MQFTLQGWYQHERFRIIFAMFFLSVAGLFVFNQTPRELLPATSEKRFVIVFEHDAPPSAQAVRRWDEAVRATLSQLGAASSTLARVWPGAGYIVATPSLRAVEVGPAALENALRGVAQRDNFPKQLAVTEVLGGTSKVLDLVVSLGGGDSGALMPLIQGTLIPDLMDVPGVRAVNVAGDAKSRVTLTPRADTLLSAQTSLVQLAEGLATSLQGPDIISLASALPLWIEPSRRPDGSPSLAHALALPAQTESLRARIEERIQNPVKMNGQPAVLLEVEKYSNGNDVDISERVRAILARFSTAHRAVKLEVLTDSASYVKAAEANVLSNLWMGILLTSLCIFTFIRSLRFTAIVAAGIPVALLLTFLSLNGLSVTRNVMSLAGLALSVGVCVDSSVSVLESFERNLRDGKQISKAAEESVSENLGAVFLTSLTTLAVFIPILFLSGIVGDLFWDLALTIMTSQLVSFLIAVLLMPAIATVIYGRMSIQGGRTPKMRAQHENILMRLLRRVLTTPLLYRTAAVASILTTVWAVTLLPPTEFLPERPTPELRAVVDVTRELQPEQAARLLDRLDHAVAGLKGRNRLTRFADGKAVIDFELDASVNANAISPLENAINQAISPFECRIAPRNPLNPQATDGNNLSFFIPAERAASKLRAEINRVPGVVHQEWSVDSNSWFAGNSSHALPALAHTLSPTRTRELLKMSYSPLIVGAKENVKEGRLSPVVLTPPVEHPPSHPATGHTLSSESMRFFIESLNQKGMESLYLDGRPVTQVILTIRGRAASEVSQDVVRIAQEHEIPIEFDENERQNRESLSDLALCLLAATGLIVMILLFQNRSLAMTIIVMSTFVWGAIGAVPGLVLHKENLNASALVGFILLAGTIVNNGIILADVMARFRRRQFSPDACCIEAVKVRALPVLITALTTVFGMVPMVFDVGEGSQMYRGLAIVVVYGILASTPLSLIGIPALFMIANDLQETWEKAVMRAMVALARGRQERKP